MALLDVRNLSWRAGQRTIVSDVSFVIEAGKLTAFLGPNGAGKTTILRTVSGLLPCQAQNQATGIFYDGVCVNEWAISKRVAAGLVYLPQHSTLFERLSVWDNLRLVYENHPFWRAQSLKERLSNFWYGSKRWQDFCTQVETLLEQTGISGTKQQYAGQLSGGQKRKLEVIRALLLQPRVLMLDEPFAGVDPKSIYELKDLFIQLAHQGIGVLVSDHHVDQLLSMAQHVYVIYDGRVVASGDAQTIMDNEYTQHMYLGGKFHAEMTSRLATR